MDHNLKIEESKTKKWFGSYKGIQFEINNFEIEGLDNNRSCWTYYLRINLNRLEEGTATKLWLDKKKDSNYYDYYISEIEDMNLHGGCTWYSKESGFDGDDRVVKIGCDYQHIWDENKHYDLEYVLNDVKNSINSFLSNHKIKHWCCGNGKLYDLSEGKLIKGTFYSSEYWKGEDFYENHKQ